MIFLSCRQNERKQNEVFEGIEIVLPGAGRSREFKVYIWHIFGTLSGDPYPRVGLGVGVLSVGIVVSASGWR